MKRYIRTIEEKPQHKGNVGIWWFYNDNVLGEYCPIDKAVQDDWCIHIDYSNTNYSMFPDGFSTSDTCRFGQVIYDARSKVFEILYYSSDWTPSIAEIQSIASYFGIQDLRYDVIDGNKQIPCFNWEIRQF